MNRYHIMGLYALYSNPRQQYSKRSTGSAMVCKHGRCEACRVAPVASTCGNCWRGAGGTLCVQTHHGVASRRNEDCQRARGWPHARIGRWRPSHKRQAHHSCALPCPFQHLIRARIYSHLAHLAQIKSGSITHGGNWHAQKGYRTDAKLAFHSTMSVR